MKLNIFARIIGKFFGKLEPIKVEPIKIDENVNRVESIKALREIDPLYTESPVVIKELAKVEPPKNEHISMETPLESKSDTSIKNNGTSNVHKDNKILTFSEKIELWKKEKADKDKNRG